MTMQQAIRETLRECIREMRDLNAYRTWLLHDAWGGWEQYHDKWQKLRPTNKKFRYQARVFSVAEIDENTKKCISLTVKLSQAMSQYAGERTARQQTSDEKP